MASVRPQSAALFCAVALLATACSAAAQAAGAATTLANLPKLQHPVGSGLNKAQPLGLKPQRGKLFQKTMQEFVAAARAGNLELAQQIQQRLFQITGPKGHRRALQQVVRPPAALDQCPSLASTAYQNVSQWVAAGGNPVAASGSPLAPPPNGPLPSIRFFTFEPCAEWGCRNRYNLARLSSGQVTCRAATPGRPSVPLGDFAYFKVYDYDIFWNTDDDNVLAGAAWSNKLSNINQFTSSRGQVGASTSLQNTQNLRIVPNPTLGIKADTDVSGTINTGLQVSRAVGDNAVLGIKTALPSVSASGTFGSVLPGTTVSDRDGGNTDDNVVFKANDPALLGYYGKKH